MHLWGANAASKVWSIITDDRQVFQDTSNSLFLRKHYRQLIGNAMVMTQANKHPKSTAGKFGGKNCLHVHICKRLIYLHL